MKVLALIPARGGSKRVPFKNISNFLGSPLISYAIKQALSCSFIDRVIVDTDSKNIAEIAKKYGAEVPWLRPDRLARDDSNIIDSILYNIKLLEKKENYLPDYIILLQTTTPLREIKDIKKCWNLIKKGGATTVVTVFDTNPKSSDFLIVEEGDYIKKNLLDKGSDKLKVLGYNGFVYIIERKSLLKQKKIITDKTKIIKCVQWRSVDIDTFEDWVLAEFLYKNKKKISKRINELK